MFSYCVIQASFFDIFSLTPSLCFSIETTLTIDYVSTSFCLNRKKLQSIFFCRATTLLFHVATTNFPQKAEFFWHFLFMIQIKKSCSWGFPVDILEKYMKKLRGDEIYEIYQRFHPITEVSILFNFCWAVNRIRIIAENYTQAAGREHVFRSGEKRRI